MQTLPYKSKMADDCYVFKFLRRSVDWALRPYIANGKHNISCCSRTVVIIRCTTEFVEDAPTELRIRGKIYQNLFLVTISTHSPT